MFPIQLDAFPGYHADRAGRVMRLDGGKWCPVPMFDNKYRLKGREGRSAKLVTAAEALELSGQRSRYTDRHEPDEECGDQDTPDQQPDLRPEEREEAGRQGQAGDPGLD